MKKKIFWFCLCVMVAVSALGFTLTGVTSIAIVSSTLDSSPVGATTPSTGAFTTLQTTTGLVNGAGFQRVIAATTCTTAASTNAACTFTITWPVTFNNSSYLAMCSVDTITSGGAVIVTSTGSPKSTTQVNGQLQNLGANAAASTATVDCIGIE